MIRRFSKPDEPKSYTLARLCIPHLAMSQSCDVARTKNRPRGSPIAHGRKAVRTQSAILYMYKTPAQALLLFKTVFSAQMVFICAENTVGARGAQIR
jgi:hypothetical protein